MKLSLLNSLCYTIGWFWCVLLGIRGHTILAVLGALLLLSYALYRTKGQDIGLYIQDLLLVVLSIPLGLLLELLFIHTDLIHYKASDLFPPIWIVALYPLFALLLNHSLRVLKRSYWAAFGLGLLAAPLSYVAGRSLGGLTFPHSLLLTWLGIGLGWGLFLCLLTRIARILEKATMDTLRDRDSPMPLELLYDGECPICKREICILQRNDTQTRVKFTDIASKEFAQRKHGGIDYHKAMSQMHAIEGDGHLLIGIPAFAAVYARCELLVASTLLRIPFLRVILEPMYALFAKQRLWITGRRNPNLKP